MQKLLLAEHLRTLHFNYRSNASLVDQGKDTIDFRPVVKLFTPWANATWLITELNTEDNDQLFGLCDVGHGYPELGYASLAEISALQGPGGLRVERDVHAPLEHRLGHYAELARRACRIVA